MQFDVRPNPAPVADEDRARVLAAPAFGRVFTDHMVSVRWHAERGWYDAELTAYGPLELDPATVVLHYAQEVFEGLKAYRQADGGIAMFRPERNAARMVGSCRRMALPELPEEVFVEACALLTRTDATWVPDGDGTSLYLRPFMFAKEAFLGVRPAKKVAYYLIAAPAGAYFTGGVKPVRIWLSKNYARAGKGGTGAAKTGGNYASSLVAQQEAIANGCDQVVFLDATERRWVEELGGMNLFFVQDDGTLVTPSLTGTILEGITRDSLITLARDLGLTVEERRVDVDEWRKGAADGSIVEVFACGTAAVVTPVGALRWPGGEAVAGDGTPGEGTQRLRSTLLDIQYGRAADPHGWLHRVL